MQYLSYYQQPTSVGHALKGDFLQAGVPALLQGKTNRIEIHNLEASGLRLALTVPLHGTILALCPIRLRSCPTLAVGVLTTDLTLCVLAFHDGRIHTLGSQSVAERSATRSTELASLLASGSETAAESSEPTKLLVIHLFQGLIRVIVLDDEAGDSRQRRASRSGRDDGAGALDLSKGFTVRVVELLLNSMALLPPAPGSTQPRLATIHTDIIGQRILQIHELNLQKRALEPTDSEATSSFLPNSGIALSDPDASLMIPVQNASVQGLIVVGQDSARFVHTGYPTSVQTGAFGSATIGEETGLEETADREEMAVDGPTATGETPSGNTRRMSASQSSGKGKGKAREPPSPAMQAQLSMSPEAAASALATSPPPLLSSLPSASGDVPSHRRRSSASAHMLAASPPGALGGTKRKLSESANSSGRGKGVVRRDTRPIECRLPVSQYAAICKLSDDAERVLMVDAWGQAMYLRIKMSTRSNSVSSNTAATPSKTASSPKALPPRRLSRSSGSGAPSLAKVSLLVEPIANGRVSSPSCLVDLGEGFCFVGSHYGDSLLVKLPSEDASTALTGSTETQQAADLSIVQAYTNLAPIIDFCVVDAAEGQGTTNLVTCSGGRDDGTLRIVRHGVGLAELASLDMEGVQRLWVLKGTGSQGAVLVLSYVTDTRILAFTESPESDEPSLEELDEYPNFSLSDPTLLACTLGESSVQVTPRGVNSSQGSRWQPPAGKKITLASSQAGHLLLALAGGEIALLRANGSGALEEAGRTTLPQEAACLTLSDVKTWGIIAAVGLWTTQEIHLFSVPSLDPLDKIKLETAYLMRSIIFQTFGSEEGPDDSAEGHTYFFAGLGDGSLVSYACRGRLSSGLEGGNSIVIENTKKVVSLGSSPITLHAIRTGGDTNESGGGPASEAALFVASDRSTIVSLSGSGALTYASANLKNVTSIAKLDVSGYRSSLVIATAENVQIGRIESLQKLHVRTLRLGSEAPRRICYSKKLRAFGVVFLRETLDRSTGDISRQSSFKVLDETTFDVLADHSLEDHEEARSVACLSLDSETDDGENRFVVGTGYIQPEETECSRGRVLVFSTAGEGIYTGAGSAETRGAVHSIAQLPGGKFAVSSNHEIIVYSWSPPGALEYLCSWGGTFIAYSLISRGNLLLAVDPLRSSSMVRYDADRNKLVDVAREYSSYGVFAAAFLGDPERINRVKGRTSASHAQDTDSMQVDVDEGDRTGQKGSREQKLAGGDANADADENATIIVADLDLNLFTARQSRDAQPGSAAPVSSGGGERANLTTQGVIHLGEVVNKFAPGSLVPSFGADLGGQSASAVPELIFCTADGSIGQIASLSPEKSKTLSDLERNMRKVLTKPVGGLKQQDFRSFKSPHRTCPSLGFIDGTYVEALLSLSNDELAAVMAGTSEHERIAGSKEEVLQLVEDLERMH